MPAIHLEKIPRELEYPDHKTTILKWWEGCYEQVFIAFNPFFRLKKVGKIRALDVTILNGIEYVGTEKDIFDDFVYDVSDYIKKNAECVPWSKVHAEACPEVPFETFVLCVWISACLGRRDDVPRDIQERIEDYCRSQALFLPEDDNLSSALEHKFYEFLRAAGVEFVEMFDEFRRNVERIDVERLSNRHPSFFMSKAINSPLIHCLYSREAGIIATWGFDDVAGFIGLSGAASGKVVPEDFFEGFYADERTYCDWANPRSFLPRDQ